MGNCCVCGDKLKLFATNGYLTQDLAICDTCWTKKGEITLKRDSSEADIEKSRQAREYFKQYMNSQNIDITAKEILEKSIKKAEDVESQHYEYENRRNAFKTTTGYNFEGYKITDYLNIVSGEIVLGTGFLSELSASVVDVLGTTSSTFHGKFCAAKSMALENIINDALNIGANAIIGIDFDITTLSNNIIVVSVNGTAVKIEK